ncbi:hypothetical protein [Orrella daihaiensis]|uniref:Uncharacterized protein n=1 Tax=Orrella daihaiensis TaxID=2782176 RepID=A0ABY4AM86_9BURK|nr:hypothetical protein [Orrella daihaiensis]UOD51434.1 hypothetical protein DHf2319_06310 [Orrella daihaiensis]
MGKKSTTHSTDDLPLSIISKLSGGHIPLLPGESADEYRDGLQATITELEAKTPMQIYLAEKIFDCMWWIRRLEAQKVEIIFTAACDWLKLKVNNPPKPTLLGSSNNIWNEPLLIASAKAVGHSVQSLMAEATKWQVAALGNLDARIADRLKAMQGFQASYEALVKRKLVIERLRLQNENLSRNVHAIEMQPVSNDRETDDE